MTTEPKSVNNMLRYTFLLHAVVALIFGFLMLFIPGRLLGFFDWAPIDPLISRLLGAALIGWGWSSIRGYMAKSWSQVSIVVQAEAVFCTLAAIGLLRHLLIANYPWYVWMTFGFFLLFAILWIAAYFTNRD
jgi:hypothetical protein